MASQISHNVYFTLKDQSADKQEALIEACNKYLKPQPGVVFFSAGARDPSYQRDVNDTDFDVALTLVFDSVAEHDRYQEDETHGTFIAEQKDNWAQVRVFDARV